MVMEKIENKKKLDKTTKQYKMKEKFDLLSRNWWYVSDNYFYHKIET